MRRIGLFVVMLLQSAPALSEDSIYLVGGWGMDDSLIQSGSIASTQVKGLGWQHDLGATFDDPILGVGHWYVVTEWHQLNGEHNNARYQLEIWAVKPTLRLFHGADRNARWIYEAALGVANFSTPEYEEIKMSSELNFAMHFSLGYQFGERQQWSSSLRYNHYSNGYLDQPNPGLDFASLTLSYQFQ